MKKSFFGKNLVFVFYLGFLVFFSGCANQSKHDSTRVSENPSAKELVEPINSKSTNPAIGHLRELASEATAARDYDKANALLERALRLAPHRAVTYLELARVKAASGDLLQALVFAERGLLYCKHPICHALNSFIEEAKNESSSR